MIHTLLPIQYLQNAGGRLAEPEKRLALAVLQTVIYDCRTVEDPHVDGPARARDHQAYGRAMAYVASRDRSWPYSFENLCDTLGVDAGHLRRGITQRQIVAA
jgi:hypothetical protein